MHSKPWGWNVVESAKWTSWKQLANMPVRSSQLPTRPGAARTASHASPSPLRCVPSQAGGVGKWLSAWQDDEGPHGPPEGWLKLRRAYSPRCCERV